MGRVRVGSPSPRMSRDEHVSEWMYCVRECLLRLRLCLLLYLLRGSVPAGAHVRPLYWYCIIAHEKLCGFSKTFNLITRPVERRVRRARRAWVPIVGKLMMQRQSALVTAFLLHCDGKNNSCLILCIMNRSDHDFPVFYITKREYLTFGLFRGERK